MFSFITEAAQCIGWKVGETEVVLIVWEWLQNVISILPQVMCMPGTQNICEIVVVSDALVLSPRL